MAQKLIFLFDTLISWMNRIGTAWVFILLILINLDIFKRFLLNAPIRGVPEMVSISIVGLVFMQLAHTLKQGRLTRAETFLNWLKARYFKAAVCLEALFHLVGAALFIVIFAGSLPLFIRAWSIKEYVGAQGDFMIPVWPVKLIILVGSLAVVLQFLILALDNLRALGQSLPPTRE
jgi:TRAP-type mannitol/chloroaromatic compound transport system permease small subunit